MFEKDGGQCTVDPCEGATLGSIVVVDEDGTVYLADGEYGLVRRGSASDADRSSRGGLGF